MRSDPRPLVILLGPTGVGKSAAAVDLALRFEGEIINADSMQVYAGFDIGTAKPSAEDRRRAPHHLLDVADPRSQFSAAAFVGRALDALRLIEGRGRLALVVGGTGLYLKALTDGLFPGPGRDEALREKLESRVRASGLESLWKELERVDPKYAASVGPRDRVRIVRALEVYELTGRPISENFSATASPVADRRLIKLGLTADRADLYARTDARVDRMFRAGLVAEVRRLLAAGVPETAPPFKALGYKQVLRHFRGEITLDEAVRLTKLDTRHFAKRQMTWFRKIAGVRWFPAGDRAALVAHLESELAER